MKNQIKKILGDRAINHARAASLKLQLVWYELVLRSMWMARIHYLLFSRAFDREMCSVIAGHLEFQRNRHSSESVNYFLRRSIHRLEKGLIMQPRRRVFGREYLDDTIECLINGEHRLNMAEIRWAHTVLTEYFEATEDHPDTRKARERFKGWVPPVMEEENPINSQCPEAKPYRRNLPETPPVRYEALLDLSVQRRSVRWFEQRPVPREMIDKALRIALLAPSACNRQPFHYRVFDDPEMISKVVDLPMGIRGYEHNIPIVIVLVGRLRAYPHPRDRHVIYIDASLSAMCFMYAVECLGLSSCPINWPDIPDREERMGSLLGLEPDERAVMLLAVGYPDRDALVPASCKIPVEEARSYNRLSSNAP